MRFSLTLSTLVTLGATLTIPIPPIVADPPVTGSGSGSGSGDNGGVTIGAGGTVTVPIGGTGTGGGVVIPPIGGGGGVVIPPIGGGGGVIPPIGGGGGVIPPIGGGGGVIPPIGGGGSNPVSGVADKVTITDFAVRKYRTTKGLFARNEHFKMTASKAKNALCSKSNVKLPNTASYDCGSTPYDYSIVFGKNNEFVLELKEGNLKGSVTVPTKCVADKKKAGDYVCTQSRAASFMLKL